MRGSSMYTSGLYQYTIGNRHTNDHRYTNYRRSVLSEYICHVNHQYIQNRTFSNHINPYRIAAEYT